MKKGQKQKTVGNKVVGGLIDGVLYKGIVVGNQVYPIFSVNQNNKDGTRWKILGAMDKRNQKIEDWDKVKRELEKIENPLDRLIKYFRLMEDRGISKDVATKTYDLANVEFTSNIIEDVGGTNRNMKNIYDKYKKLQTQSDYVPSKDRKEMKPKREDKVEKQEKTITENKTPIDDFEVFDVDEDGKKTKQKIDGEPKEKKEDKANVKLVITDDKKTRKKVGKVKVIKIGKKLEQEVKKNLDEKDNIILTSLDEDYYNKIKKDGMAEKIYEFFMGDTQPLAETDRFFENIHDQYLNAINGIGVQGSKYENMNQLDIFNSFFDTEKEINEFTDFMLKKAIPNARKGRMMKEMGILEAMKEETKPKTIKSGLSFESGEKNTPPPKSETPPPPKSETPPPPPPPSPKNNIPKETETAEQTKENIQMRISEQDRSGYAPKMEDDEGLDLDNELDVGIHNQAIQVVATANNYDFSFQKNMILKTANLPNDKKLLRRMGMKCVMEYGHLLGVLKPKQNFSKKEVEELYTLKEILKKNIRLNSSYKKAILRMNNNGGMDKMEEMYNRGDLGLLLDADSVGVSSPQKIIEEQSQSEILPQEQRAENAQKVKEELKQVSKKLNTKPRKKKRSGIIDMDYQDRRGKFKEIKQLSFRGRISDEPVLNQLTQSENIGNESKSIDFNINKNKTISFNRLNIQYNN